MTPTAREVPFDLEPETDNAATHVVKGWTPENRAAVLTYGGAIADRADLRPARPRALGTMHIAGQGFAGQAQRCTQCNEILIAAVDDEDAQSNYFPAGTRVGIDCPAGRRNAANH
jgi:hypothetical protein